MAHVVNCAKNTRWLRSSRIFAMTQNAWKRCCWHCYIWPDYFFSPIILLFMLQWHIGVYEEKFDVNKKWLKQRKIFEISLSQSRVLWRKGKLRRLSGRFQTLIWRSADTVQNLESIGSYGRVDSTDVGHSILIQGSTQIRPIGLNWFKRWSLHVPNWRD